MTNPLSTNNVEQPFYRVPTLPTDLKDSCITEQIGKLKDIVVSILDFFFGIDRGQQRKLEIFSTMKNLTNVTYSNIQDETLISATFTSSNDSPSYVINIYTKPSMEVDVSLMIPEFDITIDIMYSNIRIDKKTTAIAECFIQNHIEACKYNNIESRFNNYIFNIDNE